MGERRLYLHSELMKGECPILVRLEAATLIQSDEVRIAELEAENFELAANQCHNGYAGDRGDHRCRYQDRIAELEESHTSDQAQIANLDRIIIDLEKRIDELEARARTIRDAWCIVRDIADRPQVVEIAKRFAEDKEVCGG